MKLLASAAFFVCAFMGENWMTKMAENWEITDKALPGADWLFNK